MRSNLSAESESQARRLVRQFGRKLPTQVDRDDLLPVALFAAWEAEQCHDPARSALPTWVYRRVLRAFHRHLRAIDHLTQHQRVKWGAEPPAQYQAPVWIDTPIHDDGDTYAEVLPGPDSIDRDGMTGGLRNSFVAEMLGSLDERTRDVFVRSFWHEELDREIAVHHGRSKAWVGFLRAKTFISLRQQWQERAVF